MEKSELKQKLEEAKAKIKSNSKDAHFADMLLSDVISLKGQIDHEPAAVHVAMADIDDEYQDGSQYIAITNDGRAVYKLYGGYTIVCDARMVALNQTLRAILETAKNVEQNDDDDNEDVKLALSAMGYVLCTPVYAFADDELMYDIATIIVKHIGDMQSKAEEGELPIDDMSANEAHRDAVNFVHEHMPDAESNN